MPTEREINIECYSNQRNSSMLDSRRTDKNYKQSCGTTIVHPLLLVKIRASHIIIWFTVKLISVYCCTFITVSRKLCIAQNSGYTAIDFVHLSENF